MLQIIKQFSIALFLWWIVAQVWCIGNSTAAQTVVESAGNEVDECLKYGSCDQICANTNTAFECFCVWGYVRNRNTKTCEASRSTGPMKLFFTLGSNIHRLQHEGERMTEVVVENASVAGLDFLFSDNKLLWADSELGKVFSQSLNSSSEEDTVFLPLPSFSHVVAMAIDWVNQKLFVVDHVGLKIDVFDWRNLGRTILLWHKISNPVGIALDPKRRYMFLAANDTVIRADLDGRNPVTLVENSHSFAGVSGIAVDRIQRRVFWSSSRNNVIETVSYDGSNRVLVVKGTKSQLSPKALTMFERQLYWTDESQDPLPAVLTIDKFSLDPENIAQVYGVSTPDSINEVPKDATALTHILATHELIQTEAVNPCRSDNGGCGHLCLLSHLKVGYRCACDVGYALADDGKTCNRIEEFLLYSLRKVVRGSSLQPRDTNSTPHDVAMSPISVHRMDVIGVDFDAQRDLVYFADLTTKEIYRTDTRGKYDEKLLSAPKGSKSIMEALALDWVTENLYVVDAGLQSIWVINPTAGLEKLTLFRNLSMPRGIALHPNKGLMFFSRWGESANINRAHLDGTHLTSLPGLEVKWPNGLAIDFDKDHLYWCDALFDRIQFANLDGSNVQTIPGLTLKHPFSLSILDDWLYVSDWRPQAILRVNKRSGKFKAPLVSWPERPFTVKAFSRRNQPIDPSNPCRKEEHQCEKFCFTVPDDESDQVKAQCGCPEGLKLLSDSRSCAAEDFEAAMKPNLCPQRSFACTDSTCIPKTMVCDGKADCPDAEDERQDCETAVCSSDQFTCRDNICIPKSWMCDGDEDCSDGADESSDICSKTSSPQSCSSTEFSCGSGSCIPQEWVCDSDEDCIDGSDERQDDCHNTTCSEFKFACDGGRCLPQSWICDGERDCSDGSDEQQNCAGHTCAENEFTCDDGSCISQRWICDSENDCPNGIDEKQNCSLKTCSSTEYACGDGRCIPSSWQCDEENDCNDGSDEGPRCSRTPCPDGAETCNARSAEDMCGNGKFLCLNGNCIPRSYRCDQKDDCGDNSDEGFECRKVICTDANFQCPGSLVCIPKTWICDGIDDCSKREDERNCPDLECSPSEFRCANHGLCLPKSARCDGVPNCIDLSDELACPELHFPELPAVWRNF